MARVVHRAGPGRAALDAALASIQGKVGKVGWFASSKYPTGTPVAYVASIQEFGYAPHNLPPRLGLRELTGEKRAEWADKVGRMAGQVFKGKMTGENMLDLIGAVAEGDIRKHISDVTDPALTESTLRNRASRMHISYEDLSATGKKPLVDTGYMLATVTHQVGTKGDEE